MSSEVFFREWDARGPGERRSLRRARLLLGALSGALPGLLEPGGSRPPMLTVVGSKGKGTAAAYASAYLAAAGLRVLTVTSPAFRDDRERIRVDGRAVSAAELTALGDRIAAAMERLPEPEPGGGYLSPSGLFLVAGLLHAAAVSADVLVVEAGRGGRSDEASLVTPTVAAITPVFEEHLGELGRTVTDIARDKAAVVGAETRAVLSAPQRPEVARVIAATVAERSGGDAAYETLVPGTSGVPAGLLPGGLGAVNAELGCATAGRLLGPVRVRPPADGLRTVLSSVALPGRLSWHPVPGSSTTVLLDQAVTGDGAAAAVTAARDRGPVDHVLACLPDDKDLDGVPSALGRTPVSFVRLHRPHLRFTRDLPRNWAVIEERELTPEVIGRLGERVLAFGTASFVALMLELLDVPTGRLFTAPSGPGQGLRATAPTIQASSASAVPSPGPSAPPTAPSGPSGRHSRT